MSLFSRGKGGVTLIEMLVGIGVLVVFMAGMYSVMSTTPRVARRQQQRALAGRRAWRTLRQLSRELRAIPPGGERGGPLTGARSFLQVTDFFDVPAEDIRHAFPDGFPADSIRFATTARGNSLQGGQHAIVVEYKLRHDEGGSSGGIYRRFSEIGEDPDEGAWELFNIQALAMEFRYLDGDGEWREGWGEDFLPRAVKARVWMRTSLPGEDPGVGEFRTVINLPGEKEVIF